jgi:Tfp pilus assembly protein PilX
MGPMLKSGLSGEGKVSDGRLRDRGSALVMAAIVSVVVFALAAVLLSFANHQSTASNNDRQRQQAIDAASAGLVRADSALTKHGMPAASGSVTLPGSSATYNVTVRNPNIVGEPFRRIITSVGSSSNSVRTMEQEIELTPVGFTYGVFADDLTSGPTWHVTGDLYTNGNLTFPNSTKNLTGNFYVRGFIDTAKADVTGSLYANGYVKVQGVANIAGINGTINGSCTVSASFKPCLTEPPVPDQHLPEFKFVAANYLPVVPTYPTGPSIAGTEGVYYVTGDVSLGNLVLTGDLTIVAEGNIAMPGSVKKASAVGASVQLTVISVCSPAVPCTNGSKGTITAANNFTYSVPVLLYTKGLFEAKNSSDYLGVLYAGSLYAHANITVAYAAVKAPGFDWSNANPQNFTIRHVSTKEI